MQIFLISLCKIDGGCGRKCLPDRLIPSINEERMMELQNHHFATIRVDLAKNHQCKPKIGGKALWWKNSFKVQNIPSKLLTIIINLQKRNLADTITTKGSKTKSLIMEQTSTLYHLTQCTGNVTASLLSGNEEMQIYYLLESHSSEVYSESVNDSK